MNKHLNVHCLLFNCQLAFWETRLKFFLLTLLLTTACSQTKPTVTVSPSKVLHTGHVVMRGTGFTPKSGVSSHLRRPDGTHIHTDDLATPIGHPTGRRGALRGLFDPPTDALDACAG